MSCAKTDLIKFGSRSQSNLIGFSLAIIFVTLPWACQESFSISKWQRLAWSGSDEIDFHKPKVILHDSFFSSLDVRGMRRKALVKLSPQPTTHFNIHQSSTAREMGKLTGNGSFHFCCVVFFATRGALCRSHLSRNTWQMRWCFSTGAQTFRFRGLAWRWMKNHYERSRKVKLLLTSKVRRAGEKNLTRNYAMGFHDRQLSRPKSASKSVFEGEDAHYRSLIALRLALLN